MTVQPAPPYRSFSGYGQTVKRFNRRLKVTDSHLVMRAQAAGIPAARLLVRAGLLSAASMLLLTVLLVAFWIFLAIAPALIFALFIYARAVFGLDGNTQGGSEPDSMGADLYAGDHDRNGHYIGHLKTTWLDE